METKTRVFVMVAMLGGFAVMASAQMGMRQPQVRGVWHPVVGSGAAYQIEREGEPKSEMTFAVVGREEVDGKPGYWLEISIKNPHSEGDMYIKRLMVLDGKQTQVKRTIMQMPGQPPMEMPMDMMQQRGRTTEQPSDIRDQAERVGSESVTTPAGTFPCDHWRLKDGSSDVWITDKVTPYGFVKTTGRESTMTLVRLITDAKSHITGTPQKLNPMEMMRRQRDRE
jgi:hypothetical protein